MDSLFPSLVFLHVRGNLAEMSIPSITRFTDCLLIKASREYVWENSNFFPTASSPIIASAPKWSWTKTCLTLSSFFSSATATAIMSNGASLGAAFCWLLMLFSPKMQRLRWRVERVFQCNFPTAKEKPQIQLYLWRHTWYLHGQNLGWWSAHCVSKWRLWSKVSSRWQRNGGQ